MKKGLFITGLLTGILVFLFLGCRAAAPTPTPKPATPPLAATPTPAPATPKPTPTISPEEAAWQKVVEAAKKEGKVTYYSSGISAETREAIAAGVKKAYGITVEYVTGRGSDLRAKIDAEQRGRAYVADLWDSGMDSSLTLKRAGLLTKADVPALREKDVWVITPNFLDPDGEAVIHTPGAPQSGTYNTSLIKPGEEPTTWQDLLNPKWKGKLALDDPSIAGPGSAWWTPMVAGKIVDMDYMRKLAQQDVLLVRGYAELVGIIARGEKHFAIATQGGFVKTLMDKGGPVAQFRPKDGGIRIPMVVGMVKNAPDSNAAMVVLNWIFTKEGQTTLINAEGWWESIRKDVPVPPGIARFLPPAGTRVYTHTAGEIELRPADQKLAASIFGGTKQ